MAWSAAVRPLAAQRFNHRYDHVLNEKGQGRLTLATGIPFVGIGELAYGLSDRVTVGFFAGVTPTVEGFGLRGRAVVLEPGDGFRVYFCMPLAFYPKTEGLGGDPWWLIRPNLNFEWVTATGFRYKVGGSFIAAASHHTLFGDGARARFSPSSWNAFHAGVSFPIGSGVTLQIENSVVMNGLKPAGKDWVGGPPVILVIGTSWSL
jgi:hypothetical protein